MKALMLAAVMALGATGASALDTYELLSKGTVIIAEETTDTRLRKKLDDYKYFWVSYDDVIYWCKAYQNIVDCSPIINKEIEIMK